MSALSAAAEMRALEGEGKELRQRLAVVEEELAAEREGSQALRARLTSGVCVCVLCVLMFFFFFFNHLNFACVCLCVCVRVCVGGGTTQHNDAHAYIHTTYIHDIHGTNNNNNNNNSNK
jgi:hypothetical protein